MFAPPCGPVLGRIDGPVIRATGIPYASAARFAPPVPAEDWIAPLHAVRPAPACPQPPALALERVLGNLTGGLAQDERCQNLSVTVPADRAPDELLPVMVWIHGGSYASGAGDARIYDPTALVAEQRVVVVAVTYRLGVLGYLGGHGRPANLGLLDQIAALTWVQRNIVAFGGDPDRVTAFGQSAGGDSVAHLMATPNAERLFSRAIIQSPPLGISRGRSRMAAAMAAAGASIAVDAPIGEVIAAQADVAAAGGSFGLRSAMVFGTQYGSAPLPEEGAVEAAWDTVAPSIDVLIGTTAQETRLFLPVLPATARLLAVPLLGRPITALISQFLTRKVYSDGVRRFAERHRRAGGNAYRYRFTWSAPQNPYGAAHAIEIPFLLGDPSSWGGIELLRGASSDAIVTRGRAIRQLWAAFARGERLPARGGVRGVISYVRV